MTVFKSYLLIIRRNLGLLLMYITIFVLIAFGIQNAYQNMGITDGFSSIKLKVAVIDREGGRISDTIRRVMDREQELTELEDDAQVIQEALYYSNVQYVIIVPEDAEEKLMQGEETVQCVSVPGTAAAYYVDAQVNQVLNQLRVYLAGGFDLDTASEKVLALGETEVHVTLTDRNGNQGARAQYNYYFTYMPYAFLGASIMTMGVIIMEFKKRNLRRRIQCSPVPFWKQNLAMAGSFLVVGGMVWGICMVVQAFLYHGGVFTSPHVGFYLLNSIACILVALSLGFLTGTIAGGPTALNGINNILSLSLCFLGGIFVPLEMLGTGMQKAACFLPTYWYSIVNSLLGDYASLSREMTATVKKGLLIQLLFALACFGITMMIRKNQVQEK